MIRLDKVFQGVTRASGEIMQLRPQLQPAMTLRGNLTIYRALKLAELDPSKDTSSLTLLHVVDPVFT